MEDKGFIYITFKKVFGTTSSARKLKFCLSNTRYYFQCREYCCFYFFSPSCFPSGLRKLFWCKLVPNVTMCLFGRAQEAANSCEGSSREERWGRVASEGCHICGGRQDSASGQSTQGMITSSLPGCQNCRGWKSYTCICMLTKFT